MASYIPAEDAPCLFWLEGFSRHLTDSSSAYGVSAADAANIAGLVDSYRVSLLVASDKATRTSTTILTKDAAKAQAVQLARTLVRRIKPNEGVSDEAKNDAGIPLPNPTRSPVPPPTTSPVLSIVGATQGSQTVRFRDSMDPDRRGKPYGVRSLYLYVAVADGPVAGIEAARFHDAYGRGPIGVAFDPADNGKTATYFARWVSTRNAVGPPSGGVSMTIAA